jgi:hypothetical protein
MNGRKYHHLMMTMMKMMMIIKKQRTILRNEPVAVVFEECFHVWKGTMLDWNEQIGYCAGRPGCRSATEC